MPSLEILKPGLLCSIQDMGRKGLAYYAIPPSGVMDRTAAKIALLLLNKSPDEPLIECTSIAPRIAFHDDAQIAISGADFKWTLNGQPVARNSLLNVKAGDILGGKMATDGLRAYIAVKGRLKVDEVYGSHATYVNAGFGGFKGRLLMKGDIIEWEDIETGFSGRNIIPVRQGPEYEYLSEKSKKQFTDTNYTLGQDSNRMGLRLLGNRLESSSYQLAYSSPVLPGFIQLPPSGLPIIILQDGQTSGGYPRIAYIRENDLSALNQIPLKSSVQFRWASK